MNRCYFCNGIIGKDVVNFTLVLHNEGSKRNNSKMKVCFDCIQFLNCKKGKNYKKGIALR